MRQGLLSALLLGLAVLASGCGSTQGIVTLTGPAGPQGPSGSPGLVYQGDYKAGTSYSPPSVVAYQGSSYVSIASSSNVPPTGSPASSTAWGLVAQVGATGAAGPQGPQGPMGPLGLTGATGAQGAAGRNLVSFLQGRALFVQGDSFTSSFENAWQNVVIARTGMSLAGQDARPGRRVGTAFECFGNPAPGQETTGFNPGFVIPSAGPCSAVESLAAGTTLAQSIAGADILLIELGTNDIGITPLGQPGDAPDSGSFYGNLRWVVETYTRAKPTLRIVLVNMPYKANVPATLTAQYAAAIVTYGNSVGVPVIDLYAKSGVNAVNASTLLSDGIHPTTFTFTNFYAPVIAQGLQQIF